MVEELHSRGSTQVYSVIKPSTQTLGSMHYSPLLTFPAGGLLFRKKGAMVKSKALALFFTFMTQDPWSVGSMESL